MSDASRSAEDGPDMARKPLSRNVKLLGWASFLNDVASEMMYPLLPQFLITVLGGNKFLLGVIEGAADSAASFVKLWSGGWSDRVRSRRGFVVFGYAMAAVARPLIGIVVAPWQLFAARIGDRLGKGIRTSPRDALIADSTDPKSRGRAFGFQRGMDHLGAAVGPMLAGAFLLCWPNQLRPLFVLTLLPGLAVVGMLVLGLREVRKAPVQAGRQPGLTLSPFDRDFKLYLLALALFTLGNSSDAFLLLRAGELGVPMALLPVLWCGFHLVKGGGSMIAGRAVDRVGPRPMILGGWILYAGIYLAFGLAGAAWEAWALFGAYALFHALTEPAEKTLVANLAGGDRKGLAYGWFNCVVGVGALPASLIFGGLYQAWGALVAFAWGAGLALAAALLLIGVRSRPATR